MRSASARDTEISADGNGRGRDAVETVLEIAHLRIGRRPAYAGVSPLEEHRGGGTGSSRSCIVNWWLRKGSTATPGG
jgi:hypothetical protein